MHAEDIIPTFLTSNIYIGICLPKALTLTRLRSYELFDGLLIVRINKSVGLRGILNFRLLRDAFPYWLPGGIPLKEGVPYALHSEVRTPPPHHHWTILALRISLIAWLPTRPLHSDGQWLLQPPRRVQAVVTHQLPAERYRQTPGAVHVEQTAVYECKQLGDDKLCNATRCESISWSPTLADTRDVLEHRYAAKQHLVHSIRGTHKADLERGMLN